MATREKPTRAARPWAAIPAMGCSAATPAANAAALAECPEGKELDVGSRTARRASGTSATNGRRRPCTRLAIWFVTRLVTATPARPRCAAQDRKSVV